EDSSSPPTGLSVHSARWSSRSDRSREGGKRNSVRLRKNIGESGNGESEVGNGELESGIGGPVRHFRAGGNPWTLPGAPAAGNVPAPGTVHGPLAAGAHRARVAAVPGAARWSRFRGNDDVEDIGCQASPRSDRKSTRLNSSHVKIS